MVKIVSFDIFWRYFNEKMSFSANIFNFLDFFSTQMPKSADLGLSLSVLLEYLNSWVFSPLHTVVSLPYYYPIHLKEKIMSKLIQKSKIFYRRCQKVRQYCKPYPKILTPGHKWPSRPFMGSKISVFFKVKRSSGLLRSL